MTGLQFISSLIHDILSWPVAFMVAAFILRHSIARVIARLTEFSYKGMGQEISVKIAELKKEVEARSFEANTSPLPAPTASPPSTPPGQSSATPPTKSPEEEVRQRITEASLNDAKLIADTSPVGAILVAWSTMERALVDTARILGIEYSNRLGASSQIALRALASKGLLSPTMQDWMSEARSIRNEVAHGQNAHIRPSDAWFYLELIQEIFVELDAAVRQYKADSTPRHKPEMK